MSITLSVAHLRLKVDQEEGTLTTVGFADNSNVTREALIPWIPLKAGGYSCSMDYGVCGLGCGTLNSMSSTRSMCRM